MSIQSQIERITQNVADTYSALEAAGATMPAAQSSDNLAATAASVSKATIPATTALLKGDGAGGVREAEQGTDYAVATQVTATLYSDAWDPDVTAGHAQTVTVDALLSGAELVIVDVDLPVDDTDSRDLILAAWLAGPGANGVEQSAGFLTFHSDTVPDVNIPIVVGVIG